MKPHPVIDGKPAYTPKVKSDIFKIPRIDLTLTFDETPVTALRGLRNEFLEFEKQFWLLFSPRYLQRIDRMNQAVEEDVRKWEGEWEKLDAAKRKQYVAEINKDLQDWIGRWLRLVEGDCADCCAKAYEALMKKLGKDTKHDRFKAMAKHATIGAVEATLAALTSPHLGLIKAVMLLIPLLKKRYDEFYSDWAQIEAISEVMTKEVAATEIAMQKYLKAKSAGAGMVDKLKGLIAEAQAPAERLKKKADELDKQIALARQSLAEQAKQIDAMEDQLEKMQSDQNAKKALEAIRKEKDSQKTRAQALDSAKAVKAKAAEVLEKVKDSEMPEFGTINKILDGLNLAASAGQNIKSVLDALMSSLKS